MHQGNVLLRRFSPELIVTVTAFLSGSVRKQLQSRCRRRAAQQVASGIIGDPQLASLM